jgi:hypothetical protein
MWVRSYSGYNTYFGVKTHHTSNGYASGYGYYYAVVPCFAIGRGKKPFNE